MVPYYNVHMCMSNIFLFKLFLLLIYRMYTCMCLKVVTKNIQLKKICYYNYFFRRPKAKGYYGAIWRKIE